MSIPFVLIVNSSGEDTFADMALATVISIRLTNPSSEIVCVIDRSTEKSLKRVSHELPNQCDRIICVDTPEGTGTFKNRWIKTQLPKFTSHPGFYIDSDTIVRKPVDTNLFTSSDFAAVINHNGSDLSTQIWKEDLEFINQMGWEFKRTVYLNGGVWFFNDTAETFDLFESWHQRWLEGLHRFGRLQDQPALNTSLSISNCRVTTLPRVYNDQVAKREWNAVEDSVIWHFFSSVSAQNTCYPKLVAGLRRVGQPEVTKLVKRFLTLRAPWKNTTLAARVVDRLWRPSELSYPCSLWMAGDQREAFSAMKQAFRKRIAW
jgi:hypothetical protein